MLLSRIQNETQAIDLAMLFMEDDALADAIIARHQAGVRVRILMEPRRNLTTPKNEVILERLKAAGIPMRAKAGGGMLHWKFMIFDAQNVVQWSAANYSDFYFKPIVPYANYTDEGIFFTDQAEPRRQLPAEVRRCVGRPGGVYQLRQHHGAAGAPISALRDRSRTELRAVREFRDPLGPALRRGTGPHRYRDVQDHRAASHADGLIRAAQRGVPVRLIVEGERYRNPVELLAGVSRWIGSTWPGVQIRDRAHEGFLHQKSTLLYGQAHDDLRLVELDQRVERLAVRAQLLHGKPWFFEWFRENFERKWTNRTGNIETVPFRPLPPDAPAYASPANGATGVATSGTALRWNPGLWGWTADIYFGTSPTPAAARSGRQARSPSEVH